MMKFFLIISFLFTNVIISKSQTQIVPCELLWVILKENDFEVDLVKKNQIRIEYDTVHGLEIDVLANIDSVSKKTEVEFYKYIFIDTLGFFSPQCSGMVENKSIDLRNKSLSLEEQRENYKRLFWITDIQPRQNDDYYIVLFRKASNEGFVYFFSIKENIIKIQKKKRFEF